MRLFLGVAHFYQNQCSVVTNFSIFLGHAFSMETGFSSVNDTSLFQVIVMARTLHFVSCGLTSNPDIRKFSSESMYKKTQLTIL